jgi:hypothetical protein
MINFVTAELARGYSALRDVPRDRRAAAKKE